MSRVKIKVYFLGIKFGLLYYAQYSCLPRRSGRSYGVVNPPIAVAGKNFRLPLRGVGPTGRRLELEPRLNIKTDLTGRQNWTFFKGLGTVVSRRDKSWSDFSWNSEGKRGIRMEIWKYKTLSGRYNSCAGENNQTTLYERHKGYHSDSLSNSRHCRNHHAPNISRSLDLVFYLSWMA